RHRRGGRAHSAPVGPPRRDCSCPEGLRCRRSSPLRNSRWRLRYFPRKSGSQPHMTETELTTVLIAMLGGAVRVSTPFMFVALGECITEKSGRINLGLEGNLVLGAMTAYATSLNTGSPWIGVLAAGGAGTLLGAMHGYLCKLPRVNDVAIGIAMMSLGTGLAFFFGKPYIQPAAPRLPSIPVGDWLAITGF